MFNIAIIEDDLILRRALSEYFERSTQIDCVIAVDTVEQFIKFHRDFLNIELVLLDVLLYDRSSIPDIPMILEREPDAEIIMYTIMDDADTIFQALSNGATGYLQKDHDIQQLEQELLSTLRSEGASLSPLIAKKIIQYFTPSTQKQLPIDENGSLNDKESLVTTLLRDGASYQEIAQLLGISINGVRYHIKKIYRKLQIKSRGDLVKKSNRK
jgi:DNA-binding NarL/FixJ family response regulator